MNAKDTNFWSNGIWLQFIEGHIKPLWIDNFLMFSLHFQVCTCLGEGAAAGAAPGTAAPLGAPPGAPPTSSTQPGILCSWYSFKVTISYF